MKGKELAKKKRLDLKELQSELAAATLEIQKNIGLGFSIENYKKALAQEMKLRKINFERDKEVDLPYKGEIAGRYKLDFLVDDRLILALQSSDEHIETYSMRLKSFMKYLNLKMGMIINFLDNKVEIKSIYR